MDPTRFDSLVRSLSRPASRRGALGVMVGALALLGDAVPGLAHRQQQHRRCTAFCAKVFGANRRAARRCTRAAARGKGLCARCGAANARRVCCARTAANTCPTYAGATCCSNPTPTCTRSGTCVCAKGSCGAGSVCCSDQCVSGDCCGNGDCDANKCQTCQGHTCTSTCSGTTPDCNRSGTCVCTVDPNSCGEGKVCSGGQCVNACQGAPCCQQPPCLCTGRTACDTYDSNPATCTSGCFCAERLQGGSACWSEVTFCSSSRLTCTQDAQCGPGYSCVRKGSCNRLADCFGDEDAGVCAKSCTVTSTVNGRTRRGPTVDVRD